MQDADRQLQVVRSEGADLTCAGSCMFVHITMPVHISSRIRIPRIDQPDLLQRHWAKQASGVLP